MKIQQDLYFSGHRNMRFTVTANSLVRILAFFLNLILELDATRNTSKFKTQSLICLKAIKGRVGGGWGAINETRLVTGHSEDDGRWGWGSL